MTGVVVRPDNSSGIKVTVEESTNVNVNAECPVGVKVTTPEPTKVKVLPGTVVALTINSGGSSTPERYRHDQASPSMVWVVDHALGFRPVVQVYDQGGSIIHARIVHISPFQTQVRFCTPRIGFALAGD